MTCVLCLPVSCFELDGETRHNTRDTALDNMDTALYALPNDNNSYLNGKIEYQSFSTLPSYSRYTAGVIPRKP